MNYEVMAVRIPQNNAEVESFEQWLEKAAAAGAELVSTGPAAIAGMMLCIFRVQKRGAIPAVAS